MSVLYSEAHDHLQSHSFLQRHLLIEAFKNKQKSLFFKLERIDVEGITGILCSPYYILFPAISFSHQEHGVS